MSETFFRQHFYQIRSEQMKNSRILTTGFIAALSIFLTFTAMAGNARGQSRELAVAGVRDPAVPASSTGSEKEKIEAVIREYLLKNPAIVREALQALQAAEERERRENAAKILKEMRPAIFYDADSPSAGNADADMAVVVFFDYNCGYCKSTLPGLDAVLLKDPSLRIVYKEFPVLGQQSYVAARAALAAGRQGKYLEFHRGLMASQGTDDAAIKGISDRLGLNFAALQRDMADPKLAEQIDRNIRLAAALEINGTPAYIIGERMIPGAIDAESLTGLIALEREKKRAATAAKSAGSRQ